MVVALMGCGSDQASGVQDPLRPEVAAIQLSPTSLTLVPGVSGRLNAEVRQANGATLSGVAILWNSSAPDVATVSEGVVTAIAGGTATVTATAAGRSSSATVNVEDVYDVDARGVPRFITRDYIELAKVSRVSRFRSGIGHDYSDNVERCRSMKHYYQFVSTIDWGAVAITAPVSGKVAALLNEKTFGTQVQIVPNGHSAFTVILFHVRPVASLVSGASLVAGQHLGTHIGSQTMSDVAIRVRTPSGLRNVSYFDAMTDSLFQSYAIRGVATRSAMIITAAERDANALTCIGEQFEGPGTLNNWTELY